MGEKKVIKEGGKNLKNLLRSIMLAVVNLLILGSFEGF